MTSESLLIELFAAPVAPTIYGFPPETGATNDEAPSVSRRGLKIRVPDFD